MAAVRKAADPNHVEDQMLTRYAVHLSEPGQPDYDGRRLTREEISSIGKHVEQCSPCREKLDRINQDYQEIEAYLEESGVPSVAIGKASAGSRLKSWAVRLFELLTTVAKALKSVPALRLYPAAATVLASLLVVVWVSPLFRGSDYVYYEMASIEDEDVTFVTRSGDTSQRLTDGLMDFSEGHYLQAVEKLEAFISEYPDDPNAAYAHYISGMACLRSAKSAVLGRFVAFDEETIDRGIRHLQKTIDLGDNPRLEEDAHWFLGKSYLMKKEPGPAMEAFGQVVDMQGRRFRQAQQIVDDLVSIAETTR
jgi:hypothetical protein